MRFHLILAVDALHKGKKVNIQNFRNFESFLEIDVGNPTKYLIQPIEKITIVLQSLFHSKLAEYGTNFKQI